MMRLIATEAARKYLPRAHLLFLRRALAHPLRLLSPLPSSPAVGKLVAAHVENRKNGLIVEIGGGTGAVTRALLDVGVSSDRLAVIEIDEELADYLRATLPGVAVITGDARFLQELLPQSWHGQLDTIVFGVPMTVLTLQQQRELIDASLAALSPAGRFLQYTYSVFSPTRARRLGLAGERLGVTYHNFLPASVWHYWRPAAAQPAAGQ
jgi:phosphatidylethanolamine/phosphatidyl-N-methylethanolamine N-methyltransferase